MGVVRKARRCCYWVGGFRKLLKEYINQIRRSLDFDGFLFCFL